MSITLPPWAERTPILNDLVAALAATIPQRTKAREAAERAAALRFSLPAGMTYNNLSELLSSELNEDFGGGTSYDMGGGRLWVRDFDDQYVIYEDRDGSLTR